MSAIYPSIITTDNCQPRVHAMLDGTAVILAGFEGMCNNCGATVPLHILGYAAGTLGEHFDKPSGHYRQIALTNPPKCRECGALVPFANLPCGKELPGLFAGAEAQAKVEPQAETVGPSPLVAALATWNRADALARWEALRLSWREQEYLDMQAWMRSVVEKQVCAAFGLSPRELGMDIGMLWRDETKGRPLAEKIMLALGIYREKYHQDATDVHVHPSVVPPGEKTVAGVRIHADKYIQPNEMWLGIENKRDVKGGDDAKG